MPRIRVFLQLLVAVVLLSLGGWRIWEHLFAQAELVLTGLAPDAVPASLVRTIPGSTGLHWFGLRIENDRGESFNGRLKLKAIPSYNADLGGGERIVRIPSSDTTITIPVSFTNMSPGGDFRWDWELVPVVREVGSPQSGSTAQIQILDEDILAFNLKSFEGEDVSPELILSTLATWTFAKDFRGPTRILADSLHSTTDDATGNVPTRGQFIRRSVQRIFKPGRLVIAPSSLPLATSGRSSIKHPDSLIRFTGETFVSPIEAALLLSALVRVYDRTTSLRLFVLPGPAATSTVSVIVAWHVQGSRWEAIAVDKIGTQALERNIEMTTTQLNSVLQTTPEMLRELAISGVFMDGSGANLRAALDLSQIEANFGLVSADIRQATNERVPTLAAAVAGTKRNPSDVN